MKRFLFVMLALCAALTFAACGDGDDHHHDGNDHHEDDGHAHDDGEHGHDHEGEHHELGHMEHEGGWEVHAGHIGELEPGHEGIFEIEVTQNGEPVSDAKVTVWLADANGEGLTAKASCDWVSDEKLFDGHIAVPEGLPEGAQLIIRVRKGDADIESKFDVEAHED